MEVFIFQQRVIMVTRTNNWLLTAAQMGLLAWSGATLAADKVYVAN